MNAPTVVADPRHLKQDTKQNGNYDAVGPDSPVSDSCYQRVVDNVNNVASENRGISGKLFHCAFISDSIN